MAQANGASWRSSVSLPPGSEERVRAIAQERGCSLADVVRDAVRIGLRSIERQERRAS